MYQEFLNHNLFYIISKEYVLKYFKSGTAECNISKYRDTAILYNDCI